MEKQFIKLNIKSRLQGKSIARKLRRQKLIPAIVYGPKTKNHLFFLNHNDAVKYTSHKYDNVIFKLDSDDKHLKNIHALIKSVDRDAIKNTAIHIDFYALNMSERIRVNVEIKFEGKPIGLQSNGIVSVVKRNVELECLPTDIPEFITADISELNIHQSLKVSDIKIPDNMKLITSETETLVTISLIEEEPETPVEATAEKEPESSEPQETKDGEKPPSDTLTKEGSKDKEKP